MGRAAQAQQPLALALMAGSACLKVGIPHTARSLWGRLADGLNRRVTLHVPRQAHRGSAHRLPAGDEPLRLKFRS